MIIAVIYATFAVAKRKPDNVLCLLPFKYIADKFQALRWYWKRGWGDEFFVTVIFLLSPVIGAFYL